MKVEKNIYNIAANYDFFESFLQFLNDNFAKNFHKTKIFLPNRRSCREFKEILLKRNQILIPQIKAILDISLDDFFDFNLDESDQKLISELSQIKVLSNLDYLFFLTKEIQNNAKFRDLDFYQAFKSAIILKELLEEIEKEEINLKDFLEIDDSTLAAHRQITLEFICDFLFTIKNKLIKENICTQISYQKLIIENFSQILAKQNLENPLIIAGSTGSINFNRKLIKEIFKQENGHVFLYNYQKGENLAENHPQFFNNKLVDFINLAKISEISYEKFKISSKNRQNLLNLMMVSDVEIEKWQNIEKYLKIDEIKQDLEENFTLIEAENVVLEAKLIAEILKENLEKKTAIIINDNLLADIIKLELDKAKIAFNDTRSAKIISNDLVNFVELIYLLFENDFDSNDFLALLKHPYCKIDDKLIAKFEITILRQERAEKGLAGIKLACENFADLKEFLNEFLAENNFDFSIKSLLKIAQNLSKETWFDLVNKQDCALDIFTLFEKLKEEENIKSWQDLRVVLSQISYFSKSNSNVNVQILSPIEARLLNFDLIILSSLNDGNFPQIESENWLGKKIRKDLKIDKFLQKNGQNAYDFCNYLSSKKLVLSCIKSDISGSKSESIFLTKFKAICQKIGAKISDAGLFLQKIDEKNSKIGKIEVGNCNPCPALDLRPQKFAITDISKLMKNPYFIYCKKILRLKPLNDIDYKNGYAEFGSFVHKALEEYVRDKNVDFEGIFREFFVNSDAKMIWWPKFESFFANFVKRNKELLACDNLLEVKGEVRINNILLHGRVDRVALCENKATIIDYKTGAIPTKKEVKFGLEPQLALSALILIENDLQNIGVDLLQYWKLSNDSLTTQEIMTKDASEVEFLIAAAKIGLEKLFDYFSKEENGYVARDKLAYDDFKHLARFDD